jgi:hypothetical protein
LNKEGDDTCSQCDFHYDCHIAPPVLGGLFAHISKGPVLSPKGARAYGKGPVPAKQVLSELGQSFSGIRTLRMAGCRQLGGLPTIPICVVYSAPKIATAAANAGNSTASTTENRQIATGINSRAIRRSVALLFAAIGCSNTSAASVDMELSLVPKKKGPPTLGYGPFQSRVESAIKRT